MDFAPTSVTAKTVFFKSQPIPPPEPRRLPRGHLPTPTAATEGP